MTKKITELTAATLTQVTDAALLALVADPSGAPNTRKVALELLGIAPSSWLDLGRAHEGDTAATGGSFTVGSEFCAVRSAQTCTGMRFYWGSATPRTIKCVLWKKGSGLQKTVDVAVSGAGVYSAAFDPVSITRNETWIVSIWEKSGTQYMPQGSAITRIPARPLRLRNYVLVNPCVYYSAGGDGEPGTTGPATNAFSCWAEPIVTG